MKTENENNENEENEEEEEEESSDDEEDDAKRFQIRPSLEEKFKPTVAKDMMHTVLNDFLSNKEYSREDGRKWCQEISDILRLKLKDLAFKKYKFVVNVVLGERAGSGLKMGTRCLWDAEADSYANETFKNDSIFCVSTIYAIYHY